MENADFTFSFLPSIYSSGKGLVVDRILQSLLIYCRHLAGITARVALFSIRSYLGRESGKFKLNPLEIQLYSMWDGECVRS